MQAELVRKAQKGLGVSVCSNSRGCGLVIAGLVPGGAARVDGTIMPGDNILEINNVDIRHLPHNEALFILKVSLFLGHSQSILFAYI